MTILFQIKQRNLQREIVICIFPEISMQSLEKKQFEFKMDFWTLRGINFFNIMQYALNIFKYNLMYFLCSKAKIEIAKHIC